jgi:basic amino acid/polyamine antiporter, APA family
MRSVSDEGHDCPTAGPSAGLSVLDGVAVLVGVVIGIGIFGFPPLVAQFSDNPVTYIGLWLAGGLVMLLGALCYAELGSTYPHSGGEYHFLRRAWGPFVALLFAWARGSVIQTGSIAAVAFIYGDYANQLVSFGPWGAALHGASAIIALTGLNMLGTHGSKRMQVVFAALTVISLLAIVAAGVVASGGATTHPPAAPAAMSDNLAGMLGMGMVFVLLTYGGWNEAAYLSGELRDPHRNMARVLLIGTVVVTTVYLLANLAYLHIFGLQGLRDTGAVGAALMRIAFGEAAAVALSLMVCIAALSTMNATILTGARVYYALGHDIPQLSMLASWSDRGATPTRALLVQGIITLALMGFGAATENGIGTMVAYTAPVFWLFMFLTALAVIMLRARDPDRPRPFRTPLYPLPPLLFAAVCLGLLWSSAQYAGAGAWLGLAVLAAGVPLLRMQKRMRTGLPATERPGP